MGSNYILAPKSVKRLGNSVFKTGDYVMKIPQIWNIGGDKGYPVKRRQEELDVSSLNQLLTFILAAKVMFSFLFFLMLTYRFQRSGFTILE